MRSNMTRQLEICAMPKNMAWQSAMCNALKRAVFEFGKSVQSLIQTSTQTLALTKAEMAHRIV